MILSKLNGKDDLAIYPAAIRRVLDWLKTTDVLALEAGRVPIEGDDIYVLVQDLTTHPMEGARPEVHTKYIDLMYWPEAGERIGVSHYYGTEALAESNPVKDVAFLPAPVGENILTTAPGDIMVLFPWDAHRPGLNPGDEPVTFRKCVVKIAMSLL